MKNDITRILCAVDGSEGGHNAARQALQLARRLQVPLTILTVAPLRVLDLMKSRTPLTHDDTLPQEVDQRITGEARRVLEEMRTELGTENVTYQDVLGHPGDAICNAAQEGGFDLVVVGSRGQSNLQRLMLGSVSDYVVHHCHCPVLVVRE